MRICLQTLLRNQCQKCISQNDEITEYPQLEGTHEDHGVQLLALQMFVTRLHEKLQLQLRASERDLEV